MGPEHGVHPAFRFKHPTQVLFSRHVWLVILATVAVKFRVVTDTDHDYMVAVAVLVRVCMR